MIISASRRTDIPAFYTEWFLRRLGKEIIVINPFNKNQANSILMTKETVDCIVFWTKNPRPLLDRLGEMEGYNYYFQFTVNGYGRLIEPGVPDLSKIIGTFIELSNIIGKKKVIWRYDPVFISDEFTAEWHISNFRKIAEKIHDHTEKCVISFIDMYAKTKRNTKQKLVREPTTGEIDSIAENMSKICSEYGLKLATCCESVDLKKYGIEHNSCIDKELIRELFGIVLKDTRDAQRGNCGCLKCHDIGSYNTCLHKCIYCYATYKPELVDDNQKENDIDSPLLIGHLGPGVKVYPIKVEKGSKINRFFF